MKTNLNLKNRKISLKTVLAIVAISIVLTAYFGYVAWSNPVSPTIYLDDLPSQAYYTVKTDGTNYWVIRYDGAKVYEGIVAHTVINWAISNLPSRTWKYKIAIRGSYTLTSSITTASNSYIVLDFSEAKISTPSSAFTALTISGSSHDIDVIGGTWVGYSPSSTSSYCISTGTGEAITIKDVTASNFYLGIFCNSGGKAIKVDGCHLLYPMGTVDGGGGVNFQGVTSGVVTNCYISTLGTGIGVYDGLSKCIQIVGNDFSGVSGVTNFRSCIYLDIAAGTEGTFVNHNYFHDRYTVVSSPTINIKSPHNTITNNIFRNIPGLIIHVLGQGTTYKPCDNEVAYNQFYNCSNSAAMPIVVIVGGSGASPPQTCPISRNRFHDNRFYNCSYAVDGRCFKVTGTNPYVTDWNEIYSNLFYKTNTTIQMYDSFAQYTRIYDNEFVLTTTPISDSGTSTYIRWNYGYKTEGSGSTTNTTATTFVFNHGLVTTPLTVQASFNTIEITAWTWTATSSQITITVAGGSLPSSMTVYWEARTWNYP